MPNKLTTKDINDLLHKSNSKFNLIEGTYKGTTKRLGVHCDACGSDFNPTFNACKKLTLECSECDRRGRVQDTINKLSKIDHGDYILINPDSYNSVNELTEIKHLKCGRTFKVRLDSMLSKVPKGRRSAARCPYCRNNHKIEKTEALVRLIDTTWKIISDYKGWNDQAIFECKKCGYINRISFREAVRNNSCPHCKRAFTESQYKNKLKNIWGSRVSLISKYTTMNKKLKFRCNICGKYFIAQGNKLVRENGKASGCPYCSASHMENFSWRYFTNNAIRYQYQVKFKDLKDYQMLSYDFYLPDINLLIELDGDQHFKPYKCFGGIKRLHKQQYHDQLKENYARKKGYNLLRISYDLLNDLDKVYSKYLLKFSRNTCKIVKVGEDYKLLKNA